MPPKRVSVVTDSVSPDFFFPLWHQYYGGHFTYPRLYVVTYDGMASRFRDFELGGVWEIPFRYEDRQRARSMSAIVNALLTTSDVVIRVDTDELLVADPEKYQNLPHYIEQLALPYVTARGMNLTQASDEPPINIKNPILYSQRKWVRPVGPMNKTCVTTVPTQWGPGFHWCMHHPQFHELFLFHLKHADADIQLSFGAWMLEQVRGNTQFEQYYNVDEARIIANRNMVFNYPEEEGLQALYRDKFTRDFLDTVEFTTHAGIYHGKDIYEQVRIKLPPSFMGCL